VRLDPVVFETQAEPFGAVRQLMVLEFQSDVVLGRHRRFPAAVNLTFRTSAE